MDRPLQMECPLQMEHPLQMERPLQIEHTPQIERPLQMEHPLQMERILNGTSGNNVQKSRYLNMIRMYVIFFKEYSIVIFGQFWQP